MRTTNPPSISVSRRGLAAALARAEAEYVDAQRALAVSDANDNRTRYARARADYEALNQAVVFALRGNDAESIA